jgi:proline iminopeptidase
MNLRCVLYCHNGSHMSLYDDQQIWFSGLIQFLGNVDAGK